jgi:triosephosphate isomerase
MKQIILGTSWKMNLGVSVSLDYAIKLNDFINKNVTDDYNIEIFVMPDFLSIYSILKELAGKTKISFGAMDCFWEDKGAYTGEVSPMFLKEIGCVYVMAGHPERIKYLKEDVEMVNRKLKACLRNSLTPVLPIIEYEKDTDIRRTCLKLKEQLFSYIAGIDETEINRLVLIYEPAWAISTSSSAPAGHAHDIINALREDLDKEFGNQRGRKQKIMYGGGIRIERAKEIMELDNIDGIGMGKAGLSFEYFTGIIGLAMEIQKKSNVK